MKCSFLVKLNGQNPSAVVSFSIKEKGILRSLDDVKSLWPLWAGLYMCYKGDNKKMQLRKPEQIYKSYLKYGLTAATRGHEVGIASNRREERYGEYFFGLVHTARHARGDGCASGCSI